jgi:predicted GNAT family acetyltransferase
MAGSTAECRSLGMVVDVCTHPDSRGKGLATKCIAKLSNDLLQDNKMPCLFFGSPESGNLYRKIGYEDIAGWSMRKK